MMRTAVAVAALAACMATAAAPARAEDMFLCGDPLPLPSGQPCDDLTAANLQAFDIPNTVEIASNSLTTPGTPIDTADLMFSFLLDNGGFQFCFGLCLESDIDAGLLAAAQAGVLTEAQRRTFSEQCLLGTSFPMIFDDIASDANPSTPPTNTLTGVPGAAGVIFFLVPNNKGSDFAANTDDYFPASPGATTVKPGPIFSLSNANPGGKDQLAVYADSSNTAFAWEDKQRVPGSPEGASDEDFNDLVFSVNTVLIPGTLGCACSNTDNVVYAGPSDQTYTASSGDSDDKCVSIEFLNDL